MLFFHQTHPESPLPCLSPVTQLSCPSTQGAGVAEGNNPRMSLVSWAIVHWSRSVFLVTSPVLFPPQSSDSDPIPCHQCPTKFLSIFLSSLLPHQHHLTTSHLMVPPLSSLLPFKINFLKECDPLHCWSLPPAPLLTAICLYCIGETKLFSLRSPMTSGKSSGYFSILISFGPSAASHSTSHFFPLKQSFPLVSVTSYSSKFPSISLAIPSLFMSPFSIFFP